MDSNGLALDVSAEEARALHRVVRAMHDGHCPNCGYLGSAESFVVKRMPRGGSFHRIGHGCPECKFFVTNDQSKAALKAFQPHLEKSLAVFKKWRKSFRNEIDA